jgi:hypothetical protein
MPTAKLKFITKTVLSPKTFTTTTNMSHHMITNPEDIAAYRLLTIRSGLKLELLGLRHSTNAIFKAAKQITGEKTRQKCLEALNKMIDEA